MAVFGIHHRFVLFFLYIPILLTLDRWVFLLMIFNTKICYDISEDYERMGIPDSNWRVTSINAEYLLCSTYPQKL